MPRYYFHITGRLEVEDDEGDELPNVELAMAQAVRIAHDLALDTDDYRGCFVRMTDEEGNELARIPVRTI